MALELFAIALASLRPDIKFTVGGNVGSAATLETGEELITLDKSDADLAEKMGWNVYKVSKKTGETEYKVKSPFGMGFADSAGGYSDMGLTKENEKEQQEKKEEKERSKRQEAMSNLKPTDLQSYGEIWNDLL
ncbi:MAG TPA: hypothetical protein VGK45_08195 [Thermoanaerobaculia bacterium]